MQRAVVVLAAWIAACGGEQVYETLEEPVFPPDSRELEMGPTTELRIVYSSLIAGEIEPCG